MTPDATGLVAKVIESLGSMKQWYLLLCLSSAFLTWTLQDVPFRQWPYPPWLVLWTWAAATMSAPSYVWITTVLERVGPVVVGLFSQKPKRKPTIAWDDTVSGSPHRRQRVPITTDTCDVGIVQRCAE